MYHFPQVHVNLYIVYYNIVQRHLNLKDILWNIILRYYMLIRQNEQVSSTLEALERQRCSRK